MKLGIDFGSTYSTLARYLTEDNRVEPLTLKESGGSSIPSAVYLSAGGKQFGDAAKNMIGTPAGRHNPVYQSFKMLLLEQDEEVLKQNGYIKRSPREITALYLNYLLNQMMLRYEPGGTIENLVLCVPEEWDKSLSSMNGRGILRKILTEEITYSNGKKLDMKDIRIVTEPEAASAYFAYEYERRSEKAFCGYLLLIDYGGGTLDITLSEINSDGKNRMEITAREHGGKGENHPDEKGNCRIGSAGIAYMQQVIRYAMEEQGIPVDFSAIDFKCAVCRLESLLMNSVNADTGLDRLEECFGEYGKYSDFSKVLTDEDQLDPMYGVFSSDDIYYGEQPLVITYRQLYSAYRDTIEQVLREELLGIKKKTIDLIRKDPCLPSQGLEENFKIALVGGFGNFYFVKEQIYEIYNIDPISTSDGRLRNIDASQKELAIACGAALIAAGKVELRKVAPMSIGLYASTASSKTINYGIRYHKEIDFTKPYFMLQNNEEEDTVENRVLYIGLKTITHLIVQNDERVDRGKTVVLKKEFLDKIRALPGDCFYYCGFSMNANGIYSFHAVREDDPDPNSRDYEIELDNLENLAELTASKLVVIE